MVRAETLQPTGAPAAALKLLADPTRLRMLALLEQEELSVGDLSRALGMAQSRVSNHLRLLREAGLLAERHAGSSTFLRLVPTRGAANGRGLTGELWRAVRGHLAGSAEHAADRMRLEAIVAERRQREGEFFDRVAGEWDKIGVDFTTGSARHRAAASLLPAGLVVADLGCGTGYFARGLLGLAARVICVDRSRPMLDQARERLASLSGDTEVELRSGELDALPIADGELDGVVAGLVLHHLPTPEGAVAEMLRCLRPGGTAVAVELAPHRETWMHAELGDRHLGLEPRDVAACFERAGFEDVRIEPLDDRYQPRGPGHALGDASGDARSDGPARLSLYLVRARKPRDL